MSPPINLASTHRRVLALLDAPRSAACIAAALGVTTKQVSRAVWHLRQRGQVRLVRRRPEHLYAAGSEPRAQTDTGISAMQNAAREARTIGSHSVARII